MKSRDYDDLLYRIDVLRRKGLSRRQIIRLAGMAVSGSALAAIVAACGGGSGDESSTTPTSSGSGGSSGSGSSSGSSSTPGATGGSPAAGGSSGTSGSVSDWQPENEVEIEYWQYAYESKVKLVDELIPKFQEQNPKIKVKHITHPYDAFRQQVQAAVQAGQGPDVLNVFYGWVPAYYLANFLKPMPADFFPPDQVQKDFFPMLSSVQFDGQYYAIPTAVRTLGLFYNKDLLAQAGFDKPPANWDELVEVAVATTKRAGDGALEQAGMTWDPDGQGHSWWRSCLTRQNGQQPISDDNTQIFWTEPAALEAFVWYLDLNRTHKTGEMGFYEDGATAFQTGHAALHIDGSYRVGTYESNAPDLPYGVAVLPERKDRASYASFWCNTITRNAEGDKEKAAAKFIQFLSTPEVMLEWTERIGELPARPEAAQDPKLMENEKLAGFLQQLDYSYADFFVDESKTRQAVLDALDRVLLQNADPEESLAQAEQEVQQTLDDFWAKI